MLLSILICYLFHSHIFFLLKIISIRTDDFSQNYFPEGLIRDNGFAKKHNISHATDIRFARKHNIYHVTIFEWAQN